MIRYGYACINLHLSKQGIMTNRGIKKNTFEKAGLKLVSEKALLNIQDLYKILQWNVDNKIHSYRMSSVIFPWMDQYEFDQLPNWQLIQNELKKCGNLAKSNNIRLSFHPGHFTILASESNDIVSKGLIELERHGQIMDVMELDRTHFYPINIHIGSTKPSKNIATKKFISNFNLLSNSVKNRLVLENDDKINCYGVVDLLQIYHEVGIPITLDFHHFKYGPDQISLEDAIEKSFATWGNIEPYTHMSSSAKIENSTLKITAHADFLYEKIPCNYSLPYTVEFEAKAKEQALLKYIKDFS